MKQIVRVVFLVALCWTHAALACSVYPDRPVSVRVTGTLLPYEEHTREDLITVKIFVQGQPWLLRVGKVEELTFTERERAVKQDILLRQVRFYGPEDLMNQLGTPEAAGKVFVIEGRLDTKQKRFLVTAVKKPTQDDPLVPKE